MLLTDYGDPGFHVDAKVHVLEEGRLTLVVEAEVVHAEDGRLELGRLGEAELDEIFPRLLKQLSGTLEKTTD